MVGKMTRIILSNLIMLCKRTMHTSDLRYRSVGFSALAWILADSKTVSTISFRVLVKEHENCVNATSSVPIVFTFFVAKKL